jgi:hypothetical protein
VSLKSKYLYTGVRIFLVIWGIASFIQGAGLSFFVNGANQYIQTTYINLVYVSVFIVSLMSFWSAKIAGLLSALSAAVALVILLTDASFQSTLGPSLLEITIRPVLTSLILLFVHHREKKMKNELPRNFRRLDS